MKMKSSKTIVVNRYTYGKYFVEIINDGKTFKVWIGHEEYGAKEIMSSMDAEAISAEKFLEVVENGLPGYKKDYPERYDVYEDA